MGGIVAHLLVKNDAEGTRFSTSERTLERPRGNKEKESFPVKRVNHLFDYLISDENLGNAIDEVNATHRWRPRHRPDKTVQRVEADRAGSIEALRTIIVSGFEPAPARRKRRWDKSAGKWRDIYEPKLWPDQYVHHALVQALQRPMMRGMDPYCCGSIRGRGIHYGVKAMKKWHRDDPKGTRWCAQLDIRHFYDSLKPEVVMARMRQLVKDHRVLDLAERVMRDGVMIGAYFSQWFANTTLQPLDHALRERGPEVTHYLRYMDNFTLYARSKRQLDRAIKMIEDWLRAHDLTIKGDWQKFRTADRMPTALGYRFGRGYTYLRKRNLFRMTRQLHSLRRKLTRGTRIPVSLAFGLLSRLGQLKHCSSVHLYRRLVRKGTQKMMKQVVREYMRKERRRWNISLAQTA